MAERLGALAINPAFRTSAIGRAAQRLASAGQAVKSDSEWTRSAHLLLRVAAQRSDRQRGAALAACDALAVRLRQALASGGDDQQRPCAFTGEEGTARTETWRALELLPIEVPASLLLKPSAWIEVTCSVTRAVVEADASLTGAARLVGAGPSGGAASGAERFQATLGAAWAPSLVADALVAAALGPAAVTSLEAFASALPRNERSAIHLTPTGALAPRPPVRCRLALRRAVVTLLLAEAPEAALEPAWWDTGDFVVTTPHGPQLVPREFISGLIESMALGFAELPLGPGGRLRLGTLGLTPRAAAVVAASAALGEGRVPAGEPLATLAALSGTRPGRENDLPATDLLASRFAAQLAGESSPRERPGPHRAGRLESGRKRNRRSAWRQAVVVREILSASPGLQPSERF